ncbi:RNA-binding protein [soil metagenome]
MNIYVSNLSFHTTDEDLKAMFSTYGEVTSVKIIFDKVTNRSRGFGFIEMAKEDEGQEAIKMLNNKEIQGRLLSVSVARVRDNSSSSYGNKSKW